MSASHEPAPPLEGVLVLDLSRMLPGAVLARQLIDLGARLVKVEMPLVGDPLRFAPPVLASGVGAAFATFLRGAESLALNLKRPDEARRLLPLVRRADVLVESFRPGVLARYGLAPETLLEQNPRLVVCSLSSFGRRRPDDIGHDLNFVAASGLLDELGLAGVPGVQLADVTAGLLACSSVLAALLARARSGRGALIEQPLATGPLPFLTWSLAEGGSRAPGTRSALLAGRCPSYALYTCGDGERVALGAIEPKSWLAFLALVGQSELAELGADPGEAGARAQARIAAALARAPRAHWLALAAQHDVPLAPVDTLAHALDAGFFADLVEETPLANGGHMLGAAPFLPSLGRTPARPAPELDEHGERLLAQLGQTPEA